MITFSQEFVETMVIVKGRSIVDDHIAELWAILPEDLREDVNSVMKKISSDRHITNWEVYNAIMGAVHCMALKWKGEL